MTRYIDAEKFEKDIIGKAKVLNDEIVFESTFVYSTLYQQPTADVVEVVRCKDCEFSRLQGLKLNGKELRKCDLHKRPCFETDYCSYGERKCEGK